MYKYPALIFLIIAILVSFRNILLLITDGNNFDKYNLMEYVLLFKVVLWYLYIPSIILFLIRLFSNLSNNEIYQKIIYIINGIVISISIMYLAILTLFFEAGTHVFD